MSRIASTFRRLLREEGGWSRSWTALAIAVCLGGGVAAYHQQNDHVTIHCDQTAANAAGLTTALSAISNGQTLCLTAAVDYGTFNGTSKTITIIAQKSTGGRQPVDATITLNFGSGDSGFTVDGNRERWDSPVGLTIPSATIVNGASDITVKNFESTGACPLAETICRDWFFEPAPAAGSNIVIDHGYFHDDIGGEATIWIWNSTPMTSGVTIKNSLFRHNSTDSIKLSNEVAATILNNKIIDSHECLPTCTGNHTDAIQFDTGNGSIIKGNWVQDADQCISNFSEGGGSYNISHNVAVDCFAHSITVMSDDPASTVAFNTIASSNEDSIICADKAGLDTPSVTNIYNNVAPGGVDLEGEGPTCVPTRNDHNVSTAVTYEGGADPTTFDEFSDFCLTPSSAGYTGADDGGQVGVCGGDYDGTNYGPPSGEGY